MSSKSTTLSARDIELLLAAIKCSKTEFAVDYPRFAQEAGLTVGSAKSAWSLLKKKLEKYRDETTTGTAETPKASPPKGKKRKATATADDDESEVTPAAKKGKRGRRSATPAKAEDGEDEDKGEVLEGDAADEETTVKAEPEDWTL